MGFGSLSWGLGLDAEIGALRLDYALRCRVWGYSALQCKILAQQCLAVSNLGLKAGIKAIRLE